MRQDTGNTPLEGTARVGVFEDKGGVGGVTYVSECQIALTAHCTGTADQGNPNHPWGLAVVGDLLYGFFSEINLDEACTVPAPPAVSDLTLFSLPPYSIYSCRDIPVEVTRFDATSAPGGVLLSWEVHSPEDVVGFDVLAARHSNAEYVKQNQELLPADTREYFDVTDGTSSYQLEIHDRNGSKYRHGPIEGTAAAPSSGLTQNWPNPFREFTDIHFSAPNAQRVTIDIYDVTGNFVARVYEGTGGSVARWDGRDAAGQRVAPGVYFYQVNAGGRAAGKKLVVFSGN
jgi:hypothetical protein